MDELVYKSPKGNPVTTSLIVADVYSKRHSDVLFSIENILLQLPDDECKRNFALTYQEVNQPNGGIRKERYYVMSRNGFILLVMGFTGEKAFKTKVDFINAFNAMENKLKSLVIPDFNDPVAAARAWADEKERNILADAKIKQLEPKADFADRVIGTDNMVDIGQAAKLLKLPFGRNTFFARLREDGIFFKHRNEPLQEFVDRGYFDLRQIVIETEEKTFSVTKVYATQKGLYWLSKKYRGDYNPGLPQLKVS